MDSYRLAKLIEFLKEEFPDGIQTFFTKNLVGDYMYVIYNEDDISVEYCPTWNYIEIFGLNTDEKNILKKGMDNQNIWGKKEEKIKKLEYCKSIHNSNGQRDFLINFIEQLLSVVPQPKTGQR